MSAYHSLELTQRTYYNQYRFAQVFASLKRAPESLKASLAAIGGVAQVQTRIVVDVTLDIPNKTEPATGRLVSVPDNHRSLLNDVYIRQGRYLEPGHREEVLVSEAFAQANHLQVGDKLGAVINGRWKQLRVVGIALSPEYIYEIRGVGELYPDNKRFGLVWMSREALGHAFDLDGAFNDVTLTLNPVANQDLASVETEVIDQIDRLLEKYGGLGAYGREDQVSHRIVSDELKQLQGMATMIPTIFLAIAAFLLHVVLSRLIGTQREQIAVLKAFGYSNLSIGFHYLKLVLVIVSGGAIVGTGVGMFLGKGLTQMYQDFFRFPLLRYEAQPSLITTAVLVSAIAAIFGGLSSVRQAIALPPAEAMRPEPPAQFRPTLLEQLGLQTFFSPVGRIILRNIERQPLRAGFSILGIAVAVAILIMGLYITDAVTHLVDVQFRQVQREDMTITFNEPRPARTRHELTHLPGVVRSEPFRTVPARLRFLHQTYRTGITGISPQGEFRRLIDRHLNTVNLPPDGIVLTSKLAEVLGVSRGDNLTIEVLEESRPVRQVPVVGLVDELIGMSAYMNIAALNHLMREGQTISGAYLMIDTLQANQLYQRLKELPAIAGFSTREAMIESFEEISGQNLLVFTSVLVIFAGIITVSVVYNSARVALSERSRELASLRIMGFTRAEIAVILLGEQALLTLLAIPLGFGLGYALAAFLSTTMSSQIYRLPLIVTQGTYGLTFLVVAIAALFSAWIIRRQLNHLDLIAVLKTRE